MFLSEICVNYFICKKLATISNKFKQSNTNSYLLVLHTVTSTLFFDKKNPP